MKRGGEDSKTTSPCHDLFGSIIIKPHNAQSTGVQQAGRHDAELVLQLNVITDLCTSIMMTYQPSIEWIGFGNGDANYTNHKE